MNVPEVSRDETPLRVFVVVASYGSSNDRYLEKLLREYRMMPFDVEIVVISNIRKKLPSDVRCVVGLPSKNPWSLPFAHKNLFVKNANDYDVFVYSEDDIFLSERHIRAFLDVNRSLQSDEIAGFLRMEMDAAGAPSYPDLHGNFHWDPRSVRLRGKFTLAHFTNEHAACYMLTQKQLKSAIESGGFIVDPHEEKYDLLCTAATDPYTQCGMEKLIPISCIDEFTVHHMSNKYAGKIGVDSAEMATQIEGLMGMGNGDRATEPLFDTETKLPRNAYSKDYYESVSKEVISAIPKDARNVLSIGCGWGATERALVERGLRVVAMPLDTIISRSAEAYGIEMVTGALDNIKALAGGERFDCVLCLNVLHLIGSPERVLADVSHCLSQKGKIVIRGPNMLSAQSIRWMLGRLLRLKKESRFRSTGVHLSTMYSTRGWCAASGLRVDQTIGIAGPDGGGPPGKLSAMVRDLLPKRLTSIFANGFVVLAGR